MTKAFAGIRVLDFSQVLAGPSCTQNLALLGADVIKIEERATGDQARGIMADNDIGRIGMSPYFLSMNANKRSITLDMKHPRALEVLGRLATTADVVVQNFRPGVLARLGFGYDAVRAIKPDIIYCSISGYGQEGPFSTAPAYDGALQAVSGLMAVTGQRDGPPTRVGSSIVDLSTAMMASFAIASALFRRSVTGEGQHVDVAMFDTALALMAPMVNVWLNTGRPPERLGNGSPAYVPTADSFPAGHGEILIAALTEKQWQGICTAIERPDLMTDPRFANTEARRANAGAVRTVMIEAFRSADAATWEKRLSAAGVPAAPILELQEALQHPQLAHRNIVSRLPGASGIDREIALTGSGFTAGADGPEVTAPPPAKGQHTDAVLMEAGYSAAEIATLRAEQVV
ncbi:MAG: CoA transferase [Proteobacteria bacterium]|nr:CoA transferase [Pseudomonadota bacterium]